MIQVKRPSLTPTLGWCHLSLCPKTCISPFILWILNVIHMTFILNGVSLNFYELPQNSNQAFARPFQHPQLRVPYHLRFTNHRMLLCNSIICSMGLAPCRVVATLKIILVRDPMLGIGNGQEVDTSKGIPNWPYWTRDPPLGPIKPQVHKFTSHNLGKCSLKKVQFSQLLRCELSNASVDKMWTLMMLV